MWQSMQQNVNHLSKLLSPIFSSCVNHHGDKNNNICKGLQDAMLRCVDKKDYSTQETASLLFNVLLVRCTFT